MKSQKSYPFLGLFLSLFLFTSIALATPAFATPANTSLMIVLGDSLSEGFGVARDAAWPALLEKRLNEVQMSGKKWTVVNAGVSGSTTASGISRIKWLAQKKPQVLILSLGANDGLRGLKVSESKKNLQETIDFAFKQNMKVVLGGLYMPPNYGKEYTAEFKKMYDDLAAKNKVIFVPFVLESVAGNPKFNLADGIHPNEAGHKQMMENIFKVLKQEKL